MVNKGDKMISENFEDASFSLIRYIFTKVRVSISSMFHHYVTKLGVVGKFSIYCKCSQDSANFPDFSLVSDYFPTSGSVSFVPSGSKIGGLQN